VTALLDAIQVKHGSSVANMVLAHVRRIMNWHQSRHSHYVSPVVRGMQRGKTKARERVLNDDEIRVVWKAAEESGTFGAIVRLLLLTAQRRDK
jgi:integrase